MRSLLRFLLAIASLASLVPRAAAQAQPPARKLPRTDHPGPWDHDILVYRLPRSGSPQKLATFPRGGVATAARLADGRIAVAHQHFPENDPDNFDKVAIRFSRDEGRTWSALEVITLRGLPAGMRFPFDPTLVPLPDGRARLYFTSRRLGRPDADIPAIYSAISSNAVDYTFEPGARFAVEGRAVIDCAVAWHRGQFHLFAPDNGAGHPADSDRDRRDEPERPRSGAGYHAISQDGLAFQRAPDVAIAGRRHWLGAVKSDGETLTFYGTGEGGVWTATSSDGQTWTLGEPLRGAPIADPAIVTLHDGAVLVVGTGPPRPDTPSAQRRAANPPRPPVTRDDAPRKSAPPPP